jgi:hypothetical protein
MASCGQWRDCGGERSIRPNPCAHMYGGTLSSTVSGLLPCLCHWVAFKPGFPNLYDGLITRTGCVQWDGGGVLFSKGEGCEDALCR